MSEEELERIPIHPYLWEMNYQSNNFINVPMHLLGHGIISDIVIEFHKFLMPRNKGVKFETL